MEDDNTNVTMGGFSLFGSRSVKVSGGDGPTIRIRGFVLFGGIDVKPPKQS